MTFDGQQPDTVSADEVTVGQLRLDLTAGRVWWRGTAVDLSPTELRLIAALAARPGEAVPTRQLVVHLWGAESPAAATYLPLYVRYLRRKLEDDPQRPQLIRVHKGTGYCLTEGTGAAAPASGRDAHRQTPSKTLHRRRSLPAG